MSAGEAFRLDGRVALVTGGTRGLGRATVAELAAAGARVMLTGRDGAAAETAARELSDELGAEIAAAGADVRVGTAVQVLIDGTVERFGRLDILVNNAGITERGPFDAISAEQWERVLMTNLTGAFYCCRAAAPALRRSGNGRIVNISSMLGAVARPDRAAYIASKGGLTSLTRALAVELAPDGITVNAICPGPFQTDLADAAARAGMLEQIPLGRWGEPAELGAAVRFLASDAAGFITGTTLTIDGGYTAQ